MYSINYHPIFYGYSTCVFMSNTVLFCNTIDHISRIFTYKYTLHFSFFAAIRLKFCVLHRGLNRACPYYVLKRNITVGSFY